MPAVPTAFMILLAQAATPSTALPEIVVPAPTEQVQPAEPSTGVASRPSTSPLVLPYRDWTPGAVRTTDQTEACSTATATVRHVTSAMKRTVGRRYRVAKGPEFTYDHLVPLKLGGSNELGNLWPEPRQQAKRKDVCENRAISMVCSRGTLTLAEAQKGFADNFGRFCASIGVPQGAE